MKKLLKRTLLLICCIITMASIDVSVKADTVTSIVMTYKEKIFTKDLYGLDISQIKSGVETDGFKSIGALCDNLTFQTNGEVQIDKQAVMREVANQIALGKTSIKIDLSQFTQEEMAKKRQEQALAAMQSGAAQQVAVAQNQNAQVNNPIPATPEIAVNLNPVLISMGIDTKIAEASTKFKANEDRAVNVRNAASKINGLIIMPGYGFSADAAFGPRTAENGYGKGNVISGGEYVKAMGGGICQVSSTLNLAVLRAGIIPTERHNHSHRSSYIGSGLDATISSGTLDYQFVNTLLYPIYVAAVSDGGVLKISIYSNHDALMGVTYEPNVVGDKMSNTTYLIGTLNGVQVSNRRCYGSKYAK